jgi:Survival motor neuron protein (SMN)
MDKSDLEEYQLQLREVETALQADPDNAELSGLHAQLKELIELSQAAIAQAEPSSSTKKTATATPTHTWAAGDECLARYSADGQWYPARITFVGGAAENRVYSIVFKGYNTTELVKAADLKSLPGNYASTSAVTGKRKLSKVEEEEREKKKKKNEKKLEVRAQKAKEQTEKQHSWQKFAKKAAPKKGIHIAGVAGTSIFKTPDNPMGRGQFHPSAVVRVCSLPSSWRNWKWKGDDRSPRESKAQV